MPSFCPAQCQHKMSSHPPLLNKWQVSGYLKQNIAESSGSLKFKDFFFSLLHVEDPKTTLYSQTKLLKNKSLGCLE